MTLGQRKQLANSVKLLLLWLAASDGKLEESELEFASAHFPDDGGTITTSDFLAVIRNSDLGTIEKAIRTLAVESRELRIAFLDMAITMCMADRNMAVPENHILRFYADALHLGSDLLCKRFQTITGVEFGDPGDPASEAWWEQAASSGGATGQVDQNGDGGRIENSGYGNRPSPGMNIAQARTVLGVSLNATPADIERAYQNLAGIFEVGRVEAMGEAAVSVANERFRKIQEAYKLLRT